MSTTPVDVPHAARPQTRWRNVLKGGVSSAGARAAASLCGLLIVPLTLRILGVEGFGVWAALQAAAGLAAMLDFGIGYRLQNDITHAAARGRLTTVRADAVSVLWMSCGLAGILGLVLLAVPTESWLTLLGVRSAPLRQELAPVAPALLGLACLYLPAMLGTRLAAGLQRQWLVGASQAATSLALLVMTAGGAALGISSRAFLAVALATPVLVNAGLTLWLLRQIPGQQPSWRPPAVAEVRRLLRSGLPYFAPQVTGVLRFSAPPFILAALLGAAAVTPYNLLHRLLTLIAQPQSWLLEPLWPAYADAAARRDYRWLRQTLHWSFVGSVILIVLPLATVPLWGRAFVEWWSGLSTELLPVGLFWSILLWHVGLAITQPFQYFLSGLGCMQRQSVYLPVTVALGLLGMAAIAPRDGLALAVAPLAAATLVVQLPCVLYDLNRVTRSWSNSPQRARGP